MLKKIRNTLLKNKEIIAILLIVLSIVSFVNIYAQNETEVEVLSKFGSTGEEVRQIQEKLKRWGYYTGEVDGIFGSQTLAAVRYFQSKNGLVVDGIVGTNTLNALGIRNDSWNNNGSTGSDSSSSDLDLLARVIHGEARGESYTGQVAVGAVVMNRIKSSEFPNTLSGVVYQAGAFDAVADGQINLTPNATSIKAAQDAMNGWDPSYGAIFYFNPATATNQWIWSRPHIITIGNHRFCG